MIASFRGDRLKFASDCPHTMRGAAQRDPRPGARNHPICAAPIRMRVRLILYQFPGIKLPSSGSSPPHYTRCGRSGSLRKCCKSNLPWRRGRRTQQNAPSLRAGSMVLPSWAGQTTIRRRSDCLACQCHLSRWRPQPSPPSQPIMSSRDDHGRCCRRCSAFCLGQLWASC